MAHRINPLQKQNIFSFFITRFVAKILACAECVCVHGEPIKSAAATFIFDGETNGERAEMKKDTHEVNVLSARTHTRRTHSRRDRPTHDSGMT